jgi:hypothetical protein
MFTIPINKRVQFPFNNFKDVEIEVVPSKVITTNTQAKWPYEPEEGDFYFEVTFKVYMNYLNNKDITEAIW